MLTGLEARVIFGTQRYYPVSVNIPARSSNLDTFQQSVCYAVFAQLGTCFMWSVLGEMGRLTAFFFFLHFLVLKSLHQNGSNKINQEGNKEEIFKSITPSPDSNLCHFSPLIPSANITLGAGKLLVQVTCVSKQFRFKHVINKYYIVRLDIDMKHFTGLVYNTALQVSCEEGIWELLQMMELKEPLPLDKW